MLIWILALVLLAIAGVCGYKLGAVRIGVSFAGLVLATILAMPLGPYLKSLVPLIGLKNPIWALVVPPVIVFVVIYAIFFGFSFYVHRKVEHHYKYDADDVQRIGWERVNKAVGLWVGLMSGAIWLFILCVGIYVLGYFTVQVASEGTTTSYVRLLNQAREDMASSGLDKAVARFDPMPPRYYEGCDILGLIYQNPMLTGRISQYPPFLMLADKQEFQDMAKDTEFNQLLLTKGDIIDIVKHPKVQAVMLNPDIVQELVSQDYKDFRTYLEKGVSPKYQDEKILGKWKLEPYSTLAQERKRHPDLSSTQMRQLKKVMMEIMPAVSFTATTDKKVVLKAEVSDKIRQLFAPPPPKVVAAPPQTAGGISPQMSARYGRSQPQPVAPAPVAPPPAAKTNEPPFMVLSAQGNWEQDGDKYQLKVQDEKGKTQSLDVTADEERLTVFTPQATLVFAKAE
jgi:hypothetical protein